MTDTHFIIGDVHGHSHLLKDLYEAAGLKEAGHEHTIVQIGDLGHIGWGTQERDLACWRFADEHGFQLIWGNHDRAVVDTRKHSFGGFSVPLTDTVLIMDRMEREGRIKFAMEIEGWLLTHAGISSGFNQMLAKFEGKPKEVARYINASPHGELINAIGYERGGGSPRGGILWRDASEYLWKGVPQIFGHTATRTGEPQGEHDQWWNIDVGVKECQTLAGMWLPSQRVVRVGQAEIDELEKVA
jgi:hypothetical protein